ncbi:hypothetical protein AURDEDRAFT_124076 [Auricularia subglabra TFB-10046 SS5]|nr:hypothetical protein AURDEDRAFT_124076 [Auricularia subglabra TFB-10046 SS5]
MRSLSIGGLARSVPGFRDEQMAIARCLRNADYSRLERIELRDECWELAEHSGWPLEQVPHISVDRDTCQAFPFLPDDWTDTYEVVFEARADGVIRVGNADWSFSRSCALSCTVAHFMAGISMFAAPTYDFGLEPLTPEIRSASVPADVFPLAAGVLGWARRPRRAGEPAQLEPRLRTLVLRGDSARVAYGDVVKFASTDLDTSSPLVLGLENVELQGERPAEFAKYFSVVQPLDPDDWSYLNIRDMLNRNDVWPGR